jgi:hypothetical protein
MVNTSRINRINYLLKEIRAEPRENYTNGKTLEKLEKILVIQFHFSYITRLDYIKEIKMILKEEGIVLKK